MLRIQSLSIAPESINFESFMSGLRSKISFCQVNRLAVSAILSGIAESLITLTDIALIGNVEKYSVESLAAAGLTGSFISGIIWIFIQTVTSLSSIVPVHVGAGEADKVKN